MTDPNSPRPPAAGPAASEHPGRVTGAAGHPIDKRAYGEWCRKPEACAGKGYCPLDPNCGD